MEEVVADVYRYSKILRPAGVPEGCRQGGQLGPGRHQHAEGRCRLSLPPAGLRRLRAPPPIAGRISSPCCRLVESYVFRRAVCGIPTNSLNKTFTSLASEIDKANYLESARAAFLLKDSYKRFPDDEEFRREFVVKDFYNFRSRQLPAEEAGEPRPKGAGRGRGIHDRARHAPEREPVPEWRQELGPEWEHVHSKYLHTIGNLTLTGYNPELSDRPFHEKRDMKDGGFADSPLRLNRGLAKLEHWNEEEMSKRAQSLADLAVKVWAAPTLPTEILTGLRRSRAVEGGKLYTLADHGDALKGGKLELFEIIRKRVLNLSSAVREEVKAFPHISSALSLNFP